MTVTNRFEGSWARVLAVFATAALLLTLVPTLAGTASADHAHDSNETERLRDDDQQDRFGTAIDIANRAYPDGTDTIVLARAEVFADALAGSLVAGQLDAPILLTTGSSLHPATAAAIDDLFEDQDDTQVVLLGGVAAISANTEQQVDARDSVDEVVRIDGRNRFDTARNIAHFVAEDGLLPTDMDDNVGTTQGEDDETPQRTAIVATGQAFADALASGPLAAGGTFPLLLTARDSLSGETEDALTDLDIDRVWVAGGLAAVSAATEAEINALGIETIRVNVPGGDRSHTAVEFAKLTREVLYTDGDEEDDDRDRHLAVATGLDANGGVDALALAPLAAKFEADLVISRGTATLDGSAVDGVTQPSTYIHERCHVYGDDETPILIAGGVAAVAETAEAAIKAAALCDTEPAEGGELTATPDWAVNLLDPEAEDGQEHDVTVSATAHDEESTEGMNVLGELFREATDEQMLALETYFAALELDEDAPAPFRFYREPVESDEDGDEEDETEYRYFVLVEDAEDAEEPEGQQVLTLDEDGNAVFTYTYDGDATEDRIVFCAPDVVQEDGDNGDDEEAEEADEPRCTDDSGDLHEDEAWTQAVAAKIWAETTDEFDVVLDSANEVPGEGLEVAGEEDEVTGSARILTDSDTNTICWWIEMDAFDAEGDGTDPGDFLAAHLHAGAEGENGPVVVDFGQFGEDELTLSGCATSDAEAEDGFDVTDFENEPWEYYVNVHSTVFPDGAARGQLADAPVGP